MDWAWGMGSPGGRGHKGTHADRGSPGGRGQCACVTPVCARVSPCVPRVRGKRLCGVRVRMQRSWPPRLASSVCSAACAAQRSWPSRPRTQGGGTQRSWPPRLQCREPRRGADSRAPRLSCAGVVTARRRDHRRAPAPSPVRHYHPRPARAGRPCHARRPQPPRQTSDRGVGAAHACQSVCGQSESAHADRRHSGTRAHAAALAARRAC
jgi:hypothetical protein